MVKTNELRYGNLFIDPQLNEIGFITGYSSRYCRLKIGSTTSKHIRVDPQTDEQIINPIELTSDILEKVGFKKDNDDIYMLQIPESQTAYYIVQGWVQLAIGYSPFKNYTWIKHLHQFQNLWFAETNTELPVDNLLK